MVISYEIQIEELTETNRGQVDQANEADDLRIMLIWRSMEISGDPPPFVQAAFDRAGVRQLTGGI